LLTNVKAQIKKFGQLHFKTGKYILKHSSVHKADTFVPYDKTELVHWLTMGGGGLLHLVQQTGDWVRHSPAKSPPHCTKRTTHQRPVYQSPH